MGNQDLLINKMHTERRFMGQNLILYYIDGQAKGKINGSLAWNVDLYLYVCTSNALIEKKVTTTE